MLSSLTIKLCCFVAAALARSVPTRERLGKCEEAFLHASFTGELHCMAARGVRATSRRRLVNKSGSALLLGLPSPQPEQYHQFHSRVYTS